MSANTAKAGLTYPSLADAPNVPSNMQTLASQLDGMVVPTYASLSAMNTANPTPKAGDICYRSDLNAFMTYIGSAWYPVTASSWTAYTPTWSGVTMGSSVSTGRYRQVGKTIDVITELTYGSGSSITGAVYATLPFSALNVSAAYWQGAGTYQNAGTGNVWTLLTSVILAGASQVHAYAIGSSFTLYELSSSGWTWTTGSSINLQIRYEIP